MTQDTALDYPDFIADLKKTYSNEYIAAQNAIGVNVKCYKEWDKSDLLALYDSYFGKSVFHHLTKLVNQARAEEEARKDSTAPVLAFAQRDLNAIAPQGLDWQGYEQLVQSAIEEIEVSRKRITTNLVNAFAADAKTEESIAAFDVQSALQDLEARQATTSSDEGKIANIRPPVSRSA